MHHLENTLYVMTPNAYAHLENATVRIDVERVKKLQVPLHHLGGLVCFGNVMVSPGLMHKLADEGKSLVLLDYNGRFKARLEGGISGNILLRKAQYKAADNPTVTLEMARAIIAGKVKNSRTVLLRGARETDDSNDIAKLDAVALSLAQTLSNLKHAADVDTLRGLEGEAAKNYFGVLPLIIKPQYREAFALNGRTRRPPLDRTNALLSFLYAMLMNDCRSALEAVGLDPQLGFLHAVRPGRAALALDLQEEFRSVVVDRFALTLINRGQVNTDAFDTREGGAVMLTEKGRKAVVVAWQERKQEIITHPLTESKMPIGLLPFMQARFMARTIRGEMEGYIPYMAR
ncbi:MAG: type I-C CRISPR-associated endonuclease Cas1c [Flavobacteriales bacterium]|jgi:CRISPR-associated protein Cas1|nr:type I-C CRISPR-associated endonuclease Cas1c [Flavobacteriales bacterium]